MRVTGRRRIRGGVLICLLLACPADAGPIGDAAAQAGAAFRGGDTTALKAIADRDTPDVWRVAHKLRTSGETEIAIALAKAATPRPDVRGLVAYVNSYDAIERAEDRYEATERLLREAREQQREGDVDTAVATCVQAARAAEAVGWLAGATFALTDAQRMSRENYDYVRAIEFARQGAQLALRRQRADIHAMRSNDEAALHVEIGAYAEADRIFTELLASAPPAPLRLLALSNRAFMEYRRGRFHDAIRNATLGLDVATSAGQRAKMLRVKALAQADLGAYEDARRSLADALDLQPGNPELRATLAGVEWSSGRAEEATDLYEALLADFRLPPHVEGSLVSGRGLALTLAGRGAEAVAAQRRALELLAGVPDPYVQGNARANLAAAHAAAKSFDDARREYEAALAIAEEHVDVRLHVECSLGLARTDFAQKRYEEAARRVDTAREPLGKMIAGLPAGVSATARAQHAELFDLGLRAAARLDDVALFCRILESGRAGALLETLEDRDAIRAAVIPEKWRKQLDTARKAQNESRALYERAVREGKRKRIRTFRKQLEAAERAVEDAVAKVGLHARGAADLLYPNPAPLADIQKALAPEEALVLFATADPETFALVVTRGTARIVSIPDRETPLAPLGLKAKRLLISPDGPLFAVSFTSLTDREVVHVPSGTTWLRLRPSKERGKGVLAVGNPDYTGRSVAALPSSEAEVKAIGTRTLLGKKATEPGFATAVATQRWQAVHLACHGKADSERPLRSHLVLTIAPDHDGYLTALEILDLDIKTDLAVLSACETGGGRVYRGEGLLGLTRAFIVAGAEQVIVSQWKVDDAATRALMVRFYELWRKGAPTATALRGAQDHVRAQPKWKDPRYWAAWMLWGHGR